MSEYKANIGVPVVDFAKMELSEPKYLAVNITVWIIYQ